MDLALETKNFDVIVVASSLGGINALRTLFSHLPADFPVPLVVIQHSRPHSPQLLCEVLSPKTELSVRWAKTGHRLESGVIYLAPAGAHTVIDSNKKLQLLDTLPINFVRPSADALFRSAAAVFGKRAMGVILTGRGRDGAVGAQEIKRMGGRILIQDRASCVAQEMPVAALSRSAVDFVLPLDRLASALVALCMVPGADRFFFIPSMYTAHLAPQDRYFANWLS